MDKSVDILFDLCMLELLHHTIHTKVCDMFDLYADIHGIRISLFSSKGELIYPDPQEHPNCLHCRLLRNEPLLDAQCRSLDKKMMEQALTKGKLLSYTCHAGMREATQAIYADNTLVGFVMLGQFRGEDAPKESPYQKWWSTQNSNTVLQEAYEKTPVFGEDKISSLLKMFQHMLELILKSHLIYQNDFDLLAPIFERIKSNPRETLTLVEASEIVGRSPQTVSRLFKKITGLTYKKYQLTSRIDFAANLLITKPNKPIQAIAAETGFEDPLYFSRIFSKHMGKSPSEYRNNPS